MISREIKDIYRMAIKWNWVPVNDDRADCGVGVLFVDGGSIMLKCFFKGVRTSFYCNGEYRGQYQL